MAEERPAGLEVVDHRSAGPRSPPRRPRAPSRRHRPRPAFDARRDQRRHDHRRQQGRRGEVGHRIEPERERERRLEEHDEQAGDRVVDDVRQRLAHPHRGVRGQQVLLGDDPRQDGLAGRPEEDRDRRDQEHERVGEPDVVQDGHRDQQHRGRPQDVRDHQHLLLVPAVHVGAGDRGEDEVRHHAHEEGQGHRERRVRDLVDEGGQGDLVHPVAEQADDLAGPQGRERRVEREAHVGVLAGALEPGGPLGDRDRDDDAGCHRPFADRLGGAQPPERQRGRARLGLGGWQRGERGRGEAHAARAHHHRPFERDRLVQRRGQAGAWPDGDPVRRRPPARVPGRRSVPASPW